MKRALTLATAVAILGSTASPTYAGDREWATAGKVMAGVGAGLLLAKAFEPVPVYHAPGPVIHYQSVVVRQPVVSQQPPQVIYLQPAHQVVVQQPAQVAYPQPAPQVVYVQPAAVHVAPQPVHYRPAPVYYPRPVVGSIGGGHRPGNDRHW